MCPKADCVWILPIFHRAVRDPAVLLLNGQQSPKSLQSNTLRKKCPRIGRLADNSIRQKLPMPASMQMSDARGTEFKQTLT
ncbi:MAG: hypothetical protein DWH78_01770 [Planctomycetota bacterium]|nr:MAG: hypothetical protein DWH78_01770 [Planctomycetota bacterium]